MVAHRNRRRPAAAQRGSTATTVEGTAGTAIGETADKVAKQKANQQGSKGDSPRSHPQHAKSAADPKETAKTQMAQAKDLSRAQSLNPAAATQTGSANGQSRQSQKNPNSTGSGYAVLRDMNGSEVPNEAPESNGQEGGET